MLYFVNLLKRIENSKLNYKHYNCQDKKVMLDCGIHPGLSGMDALPFVDMIEADQVFRIQGEVKLPGTIK